MSDCWRCSNSGLVAVDGKVMCCSQCKAGRHWSGVFTELNKGNREGVSTIGSDDLGIARVEGDRIIFQTRVDCANCKHKININISPNSLDAVHKMIHKAEEKKSG